MLKKFADELKKKREESGISLEEIAKRIRIDKKFLYNIEDGNFSFLPDLYVKAYLKEYAKEIGLEPNSVLKQFSSAKEGKSFGDSSNESTEISHPEQISPDNQTSPSKTATPQNTKYVDTESFSNDIPANSQESTTTGSYKNTLIIYSFLAITALIFAVYFIFFYNRPTEIVRETPFEEILADREKAKEQSTENPKEEPTEINAIDSLTLSFFARDSSWILVGIDNLPSKEYFLFPRRSLELKAMESFSLTIGNYRTVNLSLNGEPLTIESRPGRVAKIVVDRTGIK